MSQWLKCMISLGQFTGEYAVKGVLHDGIEFSLFVSEQDVSVSEPPKENEHVEGLIRIVCLSKKNDLSLISLPQPTFENGQIVTVKTNRIEEKAVE